MTIFTDQICPCGSGLKTLNCCGLYIQAGKIAPTPEALMRSRYTAYTLGKVDYIEKTMLGNVLRDFNRIEAKEWANSAKWQKLEIIRTEKIDFQTETVEFKAYYTIKQTPQILHEISEFKKQHDRWFYIKGTIPKEPTAKLTTPKIGRNDPCFCGSGKKYKKCCGKN
jgi:SEC-C motif-containing protein